MSDPHKIDTTQGVGVDHNNNHELHTAMPTNDISVEVDLTSLLQDSTAIEIDDSEFDWSQIEDW